MEWHWHQLDHMQIICTSFQTNNHASNSSLKFLHAGCSSWRPTNSIKVLKAIRECWLMRDFYRLDGLSIMKPTMSKHWRWNNTTTRTHLMVLYPRQSGWACTRKNIHSLAPYLCVYYSMSLINFLHLLWSRGSSSFSCRSDGLLFHNLTPDFLWPASRSYSLHFLIHAFSPNHSRPFLQHANTISTYFAVCAYFP